MREWARSVRLLTALGVLVTTAALAAGTLQQPSAAGQQLVVRALTGDGQPVLDLKPEELTLRLDGRPRQIISLTLVRPDAAAAAAAPATPASALPPPYTTNTSAATAAGGGREFVIALDDEGLAQGREQPVRAMIEQLMAGAAPGDRIGLVSLRQGGTHIAPTPDRAAIRAAVATITGAASGRETSSSFICRTDVLLSSLEALFEGASPSRVIVFASTGVARVPDQSASAGASGGLCELRPLDFENLGRAADASPAAFYIVHYPDGLATSGLTSSAQAGIENVAGVTNARIVRLMGSPEAAVAPALRETEAYYLATLEGAAGAPARRIDAQVTRENVTVRVNPVASAGAAPVAAAGAKPLTPDDMIRVGTVFRDVPLRSTGLVTRMPNSKDLMVLALFEPEVPAAKLTAAKVGLFDETGTLTTNWNAKPKELGRYPVTAAIPVPPGKYRMRVAVNDAAGKGGTTDTELVVQLTDAAPLQFGSLVLGTDPQSTKLQFTAADPQVIAFLPLYGVTKGMKITAVFEVRDNETDPPFGTTDGQIIERPGDERILWGGFGLASLEPGDYLMRVAVSVDGKEAGVVTRTLRKVE